MVEKPARDEKTGESSKWEEHQTTVLIYTRQGRDGEAQDVEG